MTAEQTIDKGPQNSEENAFLSLIAQVTEYSELYSKKLAKSVGIDMDKISMECVLWRAHFAHQELPMQELIAKALSDVLQKTGKDYKHFITQDGKSHTDCPEVNPIRTAIWTAIADGIFKLEEDTIHPADNLPERLQHVIELRKRSKEIPAEKQV